MKFAHKALVAVGLLLSSQAYAQAPRGEVAGGLLGGKEIVRGHSAQVDTWGWGWNGTLAVGATDRVSVVGAVSGLHQSLGGEVAIQEADARSVPFTVTFDTVGFAGGLRVHGDRSSSVRPFVHLLFGYSKAVATPKALGDVDLTAHGGEQRAVFSVSGPALTPGGGLDIGVNERMAVRLQIEVPSVFAKGTATSSLFVGAGLVLAVGS